MPRPRAATVPRTRSAEPAAPPEHPADRAVRLRDRSVLPADQHPALDAVLLAFRKYEAGDDDAARAALQQVGLGSPLLEWKVLLRGLLAHAAGDDARALENWQRLTPDRLPARLAAPLRAALDPAFKHAQSAKAQLLLDRQHHALTADPLLDRLRRLRGELARDKPLITAFRSLEDLLPPLRRLAPDLIPRLAAVVYRAIQSHGEPADLPRYRRLFGAPPDDPGFHKLEAIAHEDAGDLTTANRHWAAYEAWLATAPPGWPADLANRARAVILHRMGTNAAALADDPRRELRELVTSFFGPPRRKQTGPPPDPTPFWRKAADLAPGWEKPARELFDRLTTAGKPAEAEAVARRLLEHNPAALPALDALAGALAKSGRAAEALDLRLKALAANPLDKKVRVFAAYAYLAAARRHLIDGDPKAAERTLEAGRTVGEENTPAGYFALRSVVARKAGRTADADDLRAKAEAVPGGRLAARFFLAVDSGLAKLKPADKRAAETAFTDALAAPAAPLEANLLYAAWDVYHLEGVEYRGQKTQEKKIHAAILSTADGDGPQTDYENLARGVALRREWTLLGKLVPKLRARFPANPVFPLLLAEAEFAKADGYPQPHRVFRLLRDARRLAEASPERRHKELLERIARLEHEALHPAYLDEFLGDDDV